jgi:hypothetical protein
MEVVDVQEAVGLLEKANASRLQATGTSRVIKGLQ